MNSKHFLYRSRSMQMPLGPGVNCDSMSISMNSPEQCDLFCSMPASPNQFSVSVFFCVSNVVFILLRTAEFDSFFCVYSGHHLPFCFILQYFSLSCCFVALRALLFSSLSLLILSLHSPHNFRSIDKYTHTYKNEKEKLQ